MCVRFSEGDDRPFADHLSAAAPGTPIITFPNLGGNAIMVVPTQLVPVAAYPHLAAFLRQAPAEQSSALWATLGATLEREIAGRV